MERFPFWRCGPDFPLRPARLAVLSGVVPRCSTESGTVSIQRGLIGWFGLGSLLRFAGGGFLVCAGRLVLPISGEHVAVKSFSRFKVTKRLNLGCWIWVLQLRTLSDALYSIRVAVPAADFYIGGRTYGAMALWKARRDLRERVRQIDAENNAKILESERAVRWPASPFAFDCP